MKSKKLLVLPLIVIFTVTACSEQSDHQNAQGITKATTKKLVKSTTPDRWYGFSQVARGGRLFQDNCATCHKPDASGTLNWKQTDAQGRYPPPPLNGNAHAWHHPMSVLQRTVKNGGEKLGGWMPPFKDKLNNQEIDAVLAWIQSHWNDELYTAWHQRNEQAGQPIKAIKLN